MRGADRRRCGGRAEAPGGQGAGGRRRMGRRRGACAAAHGGAWPRAAAAARPTGGKVGRGKHQGGQAAAGRAALARGRAQGGPAAHAGGGRRVPRRRGCDSTTAAPIRVGKRSGSRRRPRLSSPWVDFGRRRPRRGSSTKRGGARRERRWRAAVWSSELGRFGRETTQSGTG